MRLEELRTIRGSIDSAEGALMQFAHRLNEGGEFTSELKAHLGDLHHALHRCKISVVELDDGLTRAILEWHGGRHLTREQFHLLSALNFPGVTNTRAGLGDLDD